jgi:molybdopterin-guanine dinucleotide biosynthesis protein A
MNPDAPGAPATPAAPDARLLGVVLAGGRSSRMGTDKAALTTPTGETFLRSAAATLSRLCGRVVIAGSGEGEGGGEFETVPDRRPGTGPLAGVEAALASARPGELAALVVPVDMPGLTAASLGPLVAVWSADPARMAAPSADEPLPAVVPVSLLAELTAHLDAGGRSVRSFAARVGFIASPMPPAANLNTPAEYAAWLGTERRGP